MCAPCIVVVVVVVVLTFWTREIVIDVQLWRDTQCAFDTFPYELRVGEDAFACGESPNGIWGDVAVEACEVVDEVGVGPTSRITWEVDGLV